MAEPQNIREPATSVSWSKLAQAAQQVVYEVVTGRTQVEDIVNRLVTVGVSQGQVEVAKEGLRQLIQTAKATIRRTDGDRGPTPEEIAQLVALLAGPLRQLEQDGFFSNTNVLSPEYFTDRLPHVDPMRLSTLAPEYYDLIVQGEYWAHQYEKAHTQEARTFCKTKLDNIRERLVEIDMAVLQIANAQSLLEALGEID